MTSIFIFVLCKFFGKPYKARCNEKWPAVQETNTKKKVL